MPPKGIYTREKIINAAFTVIQKSRLINLTARNVANELNSSTAPIYSYFKSMEDLTDAVLEKAKHLIISYTTRPYSSRPFLNIGIGVLLFARDYNNIYRDIFLEGNKFRELVQNLFSIWDKTIARDPLLDILSKEEKRDISDKMATFTHGIAALLCAGMINDTRDISLRAKLEEMGNIVIIHAIEKKQDKKK